MWNWSHPEIAPRKLSFLSFSQKLVDTIFLNLLVNCAMAPYVKPQNLIEMNCEDLEICVWGWNNPPTPQVGSDAPQNGKGDITIVPTSPDKIWEWSDKPFVRYSPWKTTTPNFLVFFNPNYLGNQTVEVVQTLPVEGHFKVEQHMRK